MQAAIVHATVPVQCPYSARTVPVQCPLEKTTVPVLSPDAKKHYPNPLTFRKRESTGTVVFSNGHCTGTVRALYGRCTGTAYCQHATAHTRARARARERLVGRAGRERAQACMRRALRFISGVEKRLRWRGKGAQLAPFGAAPAANVFVNREMEEGDEN